MQTIIYRITGRLGLLSFVATNSSQHTSGREECRMLLHELQSDYKDWQVNIRADDRLCDTVV